VDISANRHSEFGTGTNITRVDSATLARYQEENLATVLETNSSISIKDYGAGGIATASFRGTSGTHTGVLWNGLTINSPSLGLCDLSLVPSNLADEINIYHGGSSAVNGNSALGGLVSMESKPAYYDHMSMSLSGNYNVSGNYYGGLSFKTGGKSFSSKTQLFYNYDGNQFHFINTAKKGHPEQTQSHARVINYGFTQELGFRIRKGQEIKAGIWGQLTSRQQPPNMTMNSSESVLNDSVFRTYLSYTKAFDKVTVTAKGAYFDETENYDDHRSGINSTYKVISYMVDLVGKFYLLPHLDADAGVSFRRFDAAFDEYDGKITDRRISFYAGARYVPFPALRVRLNIRNEQVSGSHPPVVPSAGIEYSLWHELLLLKLNGGKQYNLPSLNDKYWQPGGNRDLLPESGWGGDAGFILSPDIKRNMKISFTTYQMLVNNWIQWYPIDSTGLYQASNLKKVHAWGFETAFDYSFTLKKLHIGLHAGIAYTISTNESIVVQNGETMEGKQLVYVPIYNGTTSIEFEFHKFILAYQSTFMGKRYTQADNRDSLPPFQVASIYFGKKFTYRQQEFDLYIKINNLWNEQYQQVKWHATPLRTINAGFRLTLNKIKKSKTILKK